MSIPFRMPSIGTMREQTVPRAQPIYVPGQKGGMFEHRDHDPYGRGDDGVIVIRTPTGWRVRQFEGPIEATWYATPGERADQSEGLQEALDTASTLQKSLFLSGSAWSIDRPLDVRGRYVPIRGEGMNHTVIQSVSDTASPIINAYDEGDDVQQSPVRLSDLQLYGDSKGVNGPEITQRHLSNVENLIIQFCDVGMLHRYDWLSRYCNIDFRDNQVGARTLGWSNRVTFDSCGFNENSGNGYEAMQDANPNLALSFVSCDFEFNGGNGIVNDSGAPVDLIVCYFEKNRGTSNLEVRSSRTAVSGGYNLYNTKEGGGPSAYALRGGSLTVRNVQHTVQRDSGRWENIVAHERGTISFEDCEFVQSATGTPVVNGAPFAVKAGDRWFPCKDDDMPSRLSTGPTQRFDPRPTTRPAKPCASPQAADFASRRLCGTAGSPAEERDFCSNTRLALPSP